MIHEAKVNAHILVSYKKNCQIVIRDTMHYDTPENASLEVQQSMKTSYEAMSEQIINAYIF